MNLLFRCAGDTTARSVAMATKSYGGKKPGLIRKIRLGPSGSKRIRSSRDVGTKTVTNRPLILALQHRIRDNGVMAPRPKTARQMTGLYHAREAHGMSRTELVEKSGVSKQQLSRLENGQIRLRLDHLKPFAGHLGYTPEQILDIIPRHAVAAGV
jgi:DNA-binding Xre family transcriptional regulator